MSDAVIQTPCSSRREVWVPRHLLPHQTGSAWHNGGERQVCACIRACVNARVHACMHVCAHMPGPGGPEIPVPANTGREQVAGAQPDIFLPSCAWRSPKDPELSLCWQPPPAWVPGKAPYQVPGKKRMNSNTNQLGACFTLLGYHLHSPSPSYCCLMQKQCWGQRWLVQSC